MVLWSLVKKRKKQLLIRALMSLAVCCSVNGSHLRDNIAVLMVFDGLERHSWVKFLYYRLQMSQKLGEKAKLC